MHPFLGRAFAIWSAFFPTSSSFNFITSEIQEPDRELNPKIMQRFSILMR